MRVSVFVGVSIDGFLAREDGSFDFLVPVTIGAGRPLFGGAPSTNAWRLTARREFPSGLVQARYERVRVA